MALRIGKLFPNKSVLLLCDMQDKFSKIIQHFDQVVETSGKLAQFASSMKIDTYVSEHYPKGVIFYFRFHDLAFFNGGFLFF